MEKWQFRVCCGMSERTVVLCTIAHDTNHAKQGNVGFGRKRGGQRRIVSKHQQEEMIRRTLLGRDITDARVLKAMRDVPRHRFVHDNMQFLAYADRPLPIGHQQTISQPYIVAFMAQAARLQPTHKVLEIGTGSGYGAAVLSRLVKHVYSIEIIPELAENATRRLQTLGYDNVTVRCGDGAEGWPEEQPFDAIIVTAAPPHVPKMLLSQLAVGGCMVIPVGENPDQNLEIIYREQDGYREAIAFSVRFVPMTGQIQDTHEECE